MQMPRYWKNVKVRQFAYSSLTLTLLTASYFSLNSLDPYATHTAPALAPQETAQHSESLQDFTYYNFGSSMSGDYLSGRFASRHEDMKQASALYEASLESDPFNLKLVQRTFAIMLLAGDVDKAISLIKRYENYSTIPALGQVTLAAEDIRTGNYKDSEDRLIALVKNSGKDLSDMDIMLCSLMIVWSKAGEGDFDKANQLLQTLATEDDFAPIWYYHMALLNDMAKHTDAAKAAYEKSLTFSRTYHFVRAAGNFYERQSNTARALELYKDYEKANPTEGHFVEAIARLDRGEVASQPVVPTINKAVNEVMLELVRVLYNGEMYQESLLYLQLVMHLDPDSSQGKFLMGLNMEQNAQYKQAITYFRSVPKESHLYRDSQIHVAQSLYKSGSADKSQSILTTLVEQSPNRIDALLVLADQMKQQKHYKEAAELYSQSLDRIPTIEAKHWPIFYSRAVSYERSQEWDKAEQDFIKSLELSPEQPDVLNYLAYSWLDRDKNLNTARQMVEIAIKQRPGDAHIIDSMGWAMYKLGNYAQSLTYLEQAIQIDPKDPTLHEHLGDVYWRLSREEEARFQWTHALRFREDNAHADKSPEPDTEFAENKMKLEQKIAHGLPTSTTAVTNQEAALHGLPTVMEQQ
ncbi:MAG: hypothetical protein K0R63_1139 [Rickettsiales bacterium]|nr:hypothetical protein [Rickettsiales bacterium]